MRCERSFYHSHLVFILSSVLSAIETDFLAKPSTLKQLFERAAGRDRLLYSGHLYMVYHACTAGLKSKSSLKKPRLSSSSSSSIRSPPAEDAALHNVISAFERKIDELQHSRGSTSHSGYLFRRTKKDWTLEFYALQDNSLVLVAPGGSTSVITRLMLASVRPYKRDRNFCFEIITPSSKMLVQARTQRELEEWLNALHACIASSLDIGTTKLKGDDVCISTIDAKNILKSIAGNTTCADCGKSRM